MTKEKSIQYKKAYVELNEIFKVLSKDQREKIPDYFINNISNNMDKDYKFEFDMSKGIFEQDLMVETEALLVEIYERYLAPTEEKDLWQKYDKFCLNKIENEKKAKYNDDIFGKKESIEEKKFSNKEEIENNNLPVEIQKESIFSKIKTFLKNMFHSNKI